MLLDGEEQLVSLGNTLLRLYLLPRMVLSYVTMA